MFENIVIQERLSSIMKEYPAGKEKLAQKSQSSHISKVLIREKK
jgi:hypothetical protein